MNSKRLCLVASAFFAMAFACGTMQRSALAQGFDVVGEGFIIVEDGLDEEFLLNVDQIVVFGAGLDVSDDNSRYVAECGETYFLSTETVRPVDVVLVTRGRGVAFATLWAVFPDTLSGPHGVWAVFDSCVGSFWWWRLAGDPTNCFDAVAFDLVSLDQGF